MSENDELPVVQACVTADGEPKTYVTNEEATIVGALHGLHAEAGALKRQLADADSDARPVLEKQLAELRARRRDLLQRREAAYRRKMIMLGHLPPDDEVELL